ncbi:pectate lyase superfamily protein-domain-containing protein [Clohesyomyces aquaticus]|uniref:Pectate lyase superfamily protein-domain-containing protein n=1 Tax=Clohesyomyces aquaticus TaxID=1231657 RepID=A0A1Y1ZZ48_9PLEO|nr:pectate lyase superfamily protein-domain-containing protein [Clohesyomyces aquaticus]
MRATLLTALVWASLSFQVFSSPSSPVPPTGHAVAFEPRGGSINPSVGAHNVSSNDIKAAQQIVKNAIANMTELNKARLAKPSRNNFSLKPGTKASKRDVEKPPPLLEITDQIAQAAALLAELDADPKINSTANAVPLQKRAGTFWMEGIGRKGTVPWGNDASYKVLRNVVTDYNADPSGKTDSTKAIQKAIDEGKRCGANCNGSTTKNAIVYFPPGTYLVSSSISVYFGTQIIGDANSWPTILAAKSFVGLGVLSTDVYVDGGGNGPDGNSLEWYINTARFYGQIRNIKIDIRATDPGAYVAALHYQVAQATTIENVELIADSGTTQQGIFAENGSGGVMSDITFTGGNFGIYGGAQQFSAARLTFNGCNTAVELIWDWGWVWKSITVNNAQVGFRLYNDADGSIPGSVTIMDSTFSNIRESAIEMAVSKDVRDSGFTGLILDNVNLGAKIKDHWSTAQILAPGYYKSYVMGSTYKDNKRSWTTGAMDYSRETTLLGPSVSGLEVAPYFERKRNQYADKTSADFVHLKDLGAKGDGSTDDTDKVQSAFNTYGSGNKIIFVDAGTYIIKGTVTIPKDAKIVGETWSQFAASGDKFSDASKPIPMFKVGNEGDVGTVEMQDLILTSKGATPGVILMEWNVQASSAGAAALWDVHVRLGGATGTGLTPSECPPKRDGTSPSGCQVASMLLHVTKKASGYFDNMWLWVGDHMIDDPLLNDPLNNMDQLSVFSARGALIESQKATWLYGTASEHSVYYQYNFYGAQNIFTTFLQTESPYYQPTPKPPAPFGNVVGTFPNDPDYSCKGGDADGCDESWAVIMKNSQNIHIGAAGTYSWFSSYTQDCIDGHTCQKALWLLDSNYNNNRLQNIVAIGAKNIIVSPGGTAISSDANLSVTKHPAWAHISVYDVPSIGAAPPPVSENQCKGTDRMYSSEDMPQGDIELWTNDGTILNHADDTDGHQWVTIVNLTPYKMVYTGGPTPYQFAAWNFGDIPSGKARKNEATYDTSLKVGSFVDTNGFANYKLEGTSKTFQVHVTTHIPDNAGYERRVVFDLGGMGMAWRELGFPGERVSVALVITGSEQFGYVNSLQLNNVAWMSTMGGVIKDRQLRHVVVPGAHDAGMSKISVNSGWNGAGTNYNTETQSLDHYNQLRVGTRYFDMRIVSVNGGDFWSAHVTDEVAAGPGGATGESLDDLIKGVNRFMTDYPGEVIVWYIKYMVDLDNGKLNKDARYWNSDKVKAFYDKLETINNRCLGLSKSPQLDMQPMKNFMNQNQNKGCVLLLTDGRLKDGLPTERTSSGIYNGPAWLHRDDYWAEEMYTKQNADKEIARMQKYKRDNESSALGSDDYFIMQWQVTPELIIIPPPTLQLIANQETNPALYHYGVNKMSPESFPTVIQQDAVGLFHVSDLSEASYNPMMQTLAIGLNLYMVPQNCKVSNIKHPLLQAKPQLRLFAATGGSGFKTFSGVIFANGTVLDSTPDDFCRTCTFNDTSSIDHPPLNGTSRPSKIRRQGRKADLRAFM